MTRLLAFLTLVFATAIVSQAKDNKETNLLAAIRKLRDAGSYSWHTDLVTNPVGKGTVVVDGHYNSTQGLYVKIVMEKYTAELAARSGVVVARTGEDEWKPVKKFTRSDMDHSMVRGLAAMKPPHVDLETVQGSWRAGRKNTPDFFEGQLGLNTANKLADVLIDQAGGYLRGLGITKSTAAISLLSGLPDRLIIQTLLSGSGGLLSPGAAAEVTQNTQFSKIGATTVEIPKQAEAAILAVQLR